MKIQTLIFLTVLSWSGWVQADWGDWKESDDLQTQYGHGQTPEFRRAMQGAGPFNENERRAIRDLKPPKEHDRFYMRLFAYSGKQDVSRIRNLSPPPNQNGQPNETAIRAYMNRGSFALGYDFLTTRLEIEYIRLAKMYYRQTPILLNIGSTEGIDATIRSYAWFLNAAFDIQGIAERFFPFIVVGIGGCDNRVSSRIINPPAGTVPNGRQGNFHLAYGIGAGLRLGVSPRMYIDLQARQLMLGYTNLKPEPNIYLRGEHHLFFLSLGIMFLF